MLQRQPRRYAWTIVMYSLEPGLLLYIHVYSHASMS